MSRSKGFFGPTARARRIKKRVWPRPPSPPPIETHELWIEESSAPTPTSFVTSEKVSVAEKDGEKRDEKNAPPSSRTPVAVDAKPSSRRRRHVVKHHWVAIVATFIGVVALVADRADVERVLRRMKVPTHLFHLAGGGIASASEDDAGPCAKDMALVEQSGVRVCVDRFEAAVVEIGADGSEQPYSPYLSVEGHRVKAVSRPNLVPQAYISRDEAENACKEAGKRLCRADEWKTACMGPEQTLYPYGNAEDENACNTHGVAPLGALFPNYGSEIYDFRVMNDPSLDALEGTVAKTGEYPQCSNGFGLFDMVGNVHEWTSEVTAGKGEFHGGYYLDTHQNGDGCKYATYVHERSYHDYSTGFRCCADPK